MGRKAKGGGDNHLQAWRELRGLTQEKLGEKVGTTGAVISLLEAGKRPLSDKWLRSLAAALDTTAGFLLDHDPADLDTEWTRATDAVPVERRSEAIAILRVISGKAS